MRVHVVANHASIGGGEVMVLRTAHALRELGYHPLVVCPSEPCDLAVAAEAEGLPVQTLQGREDTLRYLIDVRVWSARHRRELMWCHGLRPSLALCGRNRRFVHLHQSPAPRHRWLARVARWKASRTYVPSSFMACDIPGSYVLYNWTHDVAPPVLDPVDSRAQRRPFTFTFLGRITRAKGVEVLLQAYTQLIRGLDAPQGVQLVVAGESTFVDRAEATELSQLLAQTPRAHGIGWSDTAEVLAGTDALVCPSIAPESFGLVAAEAMAAGVPVISSDAGGLPEVLGPNHPLITPAADSTALTHAMERMLYMPAGERADLVVAQRQRWQRCWSVQAGTARVAQAMIPTASGRG